MNGVESGRPLRIATLLPSATEIVCALGLQQQLVGVSHECDFPAGVDALPRLTRAKIDAHGTSAAIDTAVRDLVARGLGVYAIDTDALRAAAPDVIVTQDQCDVCAVTLADVEAAAREWLGTDARIVSLRPARFDDILADVARVGEAVDAAAAAQAWLATARERIDAVRTRVGAARYRPRVACIEWLEPLMLAGNWIPEMVELAGGRYAAVAPGVHSPAADWDRLIELDPEVAVVMPCGFGLEQSLRELPAWTAQASWRALPAVRNGRAYVVDGNAYLNRPGPRIIDSLELLGGLIQPGLLAHRIPAGSYCRLGDG